MPATYSFSLNIIKDAEFVTMMESSKNKSALIRHALHQVVILEPEREYKRKLEKLVRTYANLANAPQPNLKAIWEQCYNNQKSSQEDDPAKNLEDNECFTCNEVGKEHCNIHMNYNSTDGEE